MLDGIIKSVQFAKKENTSSSQKTVRLINVKSEFNVL